jgi:hypothetical protein
MNVFCARANNDDEDAIAINVTDDMTVHDLKVCIKEPFALSSPLHRFYVSAVFEDVLASFGQRGTCAKSMSPFNELTTVLQTTNLFRSL